MPSNCASLEDLRSRLLRNAYASYRPSLWEFISEISNSSLTLYAEWDSYDHLTLPFQVSISYADGMLHYTPLTDGPRELTEYITQYFIPRIHPE